MKYQGLLNHAKKISEQLLLNQAASSKYSYLNEAIIEFRADLLALIDENSALENEIRKLKKADHSKN